MFQERVFKEIYYHLLKELRSLQNMVLLKQIIFCSLLPVHFTYQNHQTCCLSFKVDCQLESSLIVLVKKILNLFLQKHKIV